MPKYTLPTLALLLALPLSALAGPLKHEDNINTWDELPADVQAQINSGKAWTRPFKTPDGKQGAEGFVLLPYTQDEVWGLLYDIESYPKWKRVYKEINKLEWKDPNHLIFTYTTAGAISFELTLDRVFVPKTKILIKSLAGKVTDMDGMYELTDRGNGKTLLRFYSRGRTDGWVPGFIKKYIATEGVQNDFEDIALEAMRRRKAKGTGLAPAQ